MIPLDTLTYETIQSFSTVELVNAREQEKAQGKAGKIAKTLIETDLTLLEDSGYLPFHTSGGALLHHLLSKLKERTNVAITTKRLCRTNRVRNSCGESSVVTGLHEQTHIPDLQNQELASP